MQRTDIIPPGDTRVNPSKSVRAVVQFFEAGTPARITWTSSTDPASGAKGGAFAQPELPIPPRGQDGGLETPSARYAMCGMGLSRCATTLFSLT
jgi:hypothetical protein